MLEKFILIYFAHIFLTEGIRGQSLNAEMNTEELMVNNPITNALTANIVGPNIISANPVQTNGNIDPMGLPHIMTNGPAIIEPIAASLANPGGTDDLFRSAREALIGGFANPGLSSVGFVGSPAPTGPFTAGMPGMADGVMLGTGIGGTIEAFGNVIHPTRELMNDRPIPEVIKVPSNPVPMVGLPSGANAGIPGNVAFTTYTATSPTGTSAINNNPIIIDNIVNGPMTNPVLGEVNQVHVPNGLLNPTALGSTVNGLQTSAIIAGNPTGTTTLNFASPVFANRPGLKGMVTEPLPAALSGNNIVASKQILASLTGIDPASLGTKSRFKVTSASPIAPTGLKIQADNLLMEGKLTVSGKLPFLGSVTVDGVLPDSGKGTVMYECGNGNIGMINEGPSPAVFGTMSALNPIIPNSWPNVNPLGLRNNLF